jgi:hypothetical protein
MLLPQGKAFNCLKDRLKCVSQSMNDELINRDR